MSLSKCYLANYVDKYMGQSCNTWLKEAKKLSEDAEELMYDTNFLVYKYNSVKQMGHIKHSFVLSFYFLLRSSRTKDIPNFFYKAIG